MVVPKTSKSAVVPPKRLAYRVKELCAAIGICPSTFFKLAAAGKVKTIKIGGRTLVTVEEKDRILREGVR
jgi:hypothetical protein